MKETPREAVRSADTYAWDALSAGTLDRQNLNRGLPLFDELVFFHEVGYTFADESRH